MAELTTKQASPDDFDFCWRLYAAALAHTVTPMIRGGWDDQKERSRFRSIWNADATKIITIDAREVGWYATHLGTDTLVIDHFHIMDGPQNERATKIILDVITKEANAAGKEVATEVLEGSQIKAMFENAGFSDQGQGLKTLILRRHS